MPQKILLDTNAYLRLAENIHPLLRTLIPGDNGGEIWILAELYQELKRSPRLRNQFSWTANAEMVAERKTCTWRLSESVRREIEAAYEFALQYSARIGNGASPFDILCLAYGNVLGIRVVTDDGDMTQLGQELEVAVISTLELVHLMVNSGYCSKKMAHSLVRYWIAVDDLPLRWRTEYRRLFGEDPPDRPY